MLCGRAQAAALQSAVIDEAANPDVSRNTAAPTTCHAGVRVDADGGCTGNASDGSGTFSGGPALDGWLGAGSPAGVYVEYENVSGSADWIDDFGGAGNRVAISSAPRIGCQRSTGGGADVLVVNFHFYTAGGVALGTISNVSMTASVSL